jgi:mRNA-degrading endonuclease RelE of RelBE toxin-antitoxin system
MEAGPTRRVSWRVEWEFAERALKECVSHWKDAQAIAAAVDRFAATGKGELRQLPDDLQVTRRLYVGDYRVLMTLDPKNRTIWVVDVYSSLKR